tara:strand:- start:752 stop:1108 length:357 start_codon:yes stop_codon:yes gene_type:complete
MLIKEQNKKEITLQCVDLVSKTFVELGQAKTEQDIVILAQSLSDDLLRDYSKFTLDDVRNAFRHGVRHTELYVLNVKTYYNWLKAWKRILNEAHYEVHTMGRDPKEVRYYKEPPKLIK